MNLKFLVVAIALLGLSSCASRDSLRDPWSYYSPKGDGGYTSSSYSHKYHPKRAYSPNRNYESPSGNLGRFSKSQQEDYQAVKTSSSPTRYYRPSETYQPSPVRYSEPVETYESSGRSNLGRFSRPSEDYRRTNNLGRFSSRS
jgi:hypothetical protein